MITKQALTFKHHKHNKCTLTIKTKKKKREKINLQEKGGEQEISCKAEPEGQCVGFGDTQQQQKKVGSEVDPQWSSYFHRN